MAKRNSRRGRKTAAAPVSVRRPSSVSPLTTAPTLERVDVLCFPPGGGYVRIGAYRCAVLVSHKMGAKTAVVRFGTGKQQRVAADRIRFAGEQHAPALVQEAQPS
jgi:hypothetical protein